MDKFVNLYTTFVQTIGTWAWIPLSIAFLGCAGTLMWGGDQMTEKVKKRIVGGIAAVICIAGAIYIPQWFSNQITF